MYSCRCPYLRLATDPDLPNYLLEWLIDPEYYFFEGCVCSAVSKWSSLTAALLGKGEVMDDAHSVRLAVAF